MGIAVFIGAGAALVGAFLVSRYMPADHLSEEETPVRVETDMKAALETTWDDPHRGSYIREFALRTPKGAPKVRACG